MNNPMRSKLTFKQSILAGLLAGLVAAVINALLFFVFHSAGVISDTIYPQPNQPLTVLPVLIASLVPALLGSVVFFLLETYTNNGFRIFAILSLVLMVLSMYSPFTGIPGVTTGYALALCLMHITVPLALLYFIRRAKQKKQATDPVRTA